MYPNPGHNPGPHPGHNPGHNAGQAGIACPDCGAAVWPERDRLCGNCGYPLMFLRPERNDAGSYGIARQPGERADATDLITPYPTRQQPAMRQQPQVAWPAQGGQPGELVCPRCAYRSAPTRTRCERCGAELRAVNQATVAAPPLKAPAGQRRGRTGLVVALVLAGISVLVLGTYLLVHRGSRPPVAAPPSPTAAAAPTLVRIDSGAVRAVASSTNPDEERYKVASALDGDRATAWNSNGDRLDSNIGQRITFTFDRAVTLARISVVNGYTRSPVLFRGNERVSRFDVTTDAVRTSWDLEDSDQAQVIDLDPQPTKKVVLTVRGVYDGNRYKDVCVTEVVFFERR